MAHVKATRRIPSSVLTTRTQNGSQHVESLYTFSIPLLPIWGSMWKLTAADATRLLSRYDFWLASEPKARDDTHIGPPRPVLRRTSSTATA